MKNDKHEVQEVIVYRLKSDAIEGFVNEGLNQLRGFANSQPGMMKHTTFQSVKKPDVFVDFVSWDSLENAEAAVARMDELSKTDEMKDMMQSFEKVEFFDHFRMMP